MTTPTPTPKRLARSLTRAALASVRGTERALEKLNGRLETPAADSIVVPAFRINSVGDPNGRMRIVGISGHLSVATLAEVEAALAEIADGTMLHVDLTDAEVEDRTVAGRLEILADHLEARRVSLRIVGLDPYHPALH